MTTSPSSPSPSLPPSVSLGRVVQVLTEVSQGLGQGVATLHAVAYRARTYGARQAIRDDADHLAVVQRAARDLLADLRPPTVVEVHLIPDQPSSTVDDGI